jgi:prepilin-type N-terminal cleavage/methylation domain-containing protein
MGSRTGGQRGFTLLELIVVVAVIGILSTIAMPKMVRVPILAREAVMRMNLLALRDALSQHYGDLGHYPLSLDALVAKEYLRRIPEDPITKSNATWIPIREDKPDSGAMETSLEAGIMDVRSGAEGLSLKGKPYSEY